jgi:hypothetical protein
MPDPGTVMEPFTITATVSYARCSKAVDAARAVAPDDAQHRLRRKIENPFREPARADDDAVRYVFIGLIGATESALERAADADDQVAKTIAAATAGYRAAREALDTTAAACPCPGHTWARAANQISDAIGPLSDWVYTAYNGGTPVRDDGLAQCALDHTIVYTDLDADDEPELGQVTVSWNHPTLTVDRGTAAPTLRLTLIDPAYRPAWDAWNNGGWFQDDYFVVLDQIVRTPLDVLAFVPAVVEATDVTNPPEGSYGDLVAAMRELNLTGLTPGELEYLSGLADGWDGTWHDIFTAVTELKAAERR